MRDFAKISPQIWINERGKKIKNLGIKAQLISFYLSTNPHASMIGIYYLPIAFIAHETGLSTDDVINTLNMLAEINVCTYDDATEYIWVRDMAFDQLGSNLKINDNRVKGVNDTLAALPDLPFMEEFLDKYSEAFHILIQGVKNEDPLEPLQSKEKEKKNEEEKNNNNEIGTSENYYLNKSNLDKNITNIDGNNTDLSLKAQAKNILIFLNEKLGTNYPLVDCNLQFIIERLKEGYTEKQCFQVITRKYREWYKNDVMEDYLKLEIIFGKKFPKYVGELRIAKAKGLIHGRDAALS